MKIKLFIIFNCCFLLNYSAQNFDIPVNNSKWINSRTVDYSSPPSYYYYEYNYTHYCMKNVDTIINTLSYTKVEGCLNLNYLGAFRNDNGVSYYIPKDSVSEMVVYDFTKETGDTLKNIYYQLHGLSPVLDDLIISGIDSTIINGSYRNIIAFTNGFSWLEGIGGSQGFLWDSFSSLSNVNSQLICHSYGDSIMQDPNNIVSGGCDNTLYLNKNISKYFYLKMYPNPVTNLLNIEIEDDLLGSTIVLCDYSGRLLNSIDLLDHKNKVDFSGYSKGVYFVSFHTKGGEVINKKIIRN